MYTITAYDSPTDLIGKVIFNVETNKFISSGKLNLKESDIDDFQLSVNQKNLLFGKVRPLMTHIEVKQDNKVIFKGRALKPKREMNSSGQFVQSFSFESIMAYLLDSTQRFKEVHDTSPADFFKMLINVHNSQVPKYKQFKVGKIDVTNSTDNLYRFVDYTNTYDTIKEKLITRMGGYLCLRIEPDGNYLDYLIDPGVAHLTDNPIKIGRNLKSASVEVDPTNVITRLIPLGATIERSGTNGESSVSNPRITISDVNGGQDYIDILPLQKEFGIINGTNVWDDVHTSKTLLVRAKEWVSKQSTATESWNVSAVEIGHDRFQIFNVSDSYQFINPAISESQLLRITQKSIDVMSPNSSSFTIGDKKKTLAEYQKGNSEMKRQVVQLNQKVVSQNSRITVLSDAAKKTDKIIATQEKTIVAIQEAIKNVDIAAITLLVKQLSEQITALDGSVSNMGEEIFVVQEFQNKQIQTNENQAKVNSNQLTMNESFESRITNLEKLGGK